MVPRSAFGYLRASASGNCTPFNPTFRSRSCKRRTRARCRVSGPVTAAARIVTRSFLPLPCRRIISFRVKSISLTRSRKHSIERSPEPYKTIATIHETPSRVASSASTSCCVSTVGSRCGRLARMTSSSHPGSIARKSLQPAGLDGSWSWVEQPCQRGAGISNALWRRRMYPVCIERCVACLIVWWPYALSGGISGRTTPGR